MREEEEGEKADPPSTIQSCTLYPHTYPQKRTDTATVAHSRRQCCSSRRAPQKRPPEAGSPWRATNNADLHYRPSALAQNFKRRNGAGPLGRLLLLCSSLLLSPSLSSSATLRLLRLFVSPAHQCGLLLAAFSPSSPRSPFRLSCPFFPSSFPSTPLLASPRPSAVGRRRATRAEQRQLPV